MTNNNTIIKVVIPRWVETELKGSDITLILTAYANDKKQAREANSVFVNAPEHEVKKTGLPTKTNELIFASELERQGIKPKKDIKKLLDKITSDDPCERCEGGCSGFCIDNS